MRNLILSLLVAVLLMPYANAQSIKVTGTAGSTGAYLTEFDGDYFTVGRNDGWAVVDLQGKTLMSGLKAPVSDVLRRVSLYHGVLFVDDGTGKIVLRRATGELLGTEKYKAVLPFETDNAVVALPSAPGTWTVGYVDTTGKMVVRYDSKKYVSIVQPPKGSPVYGPTTLSQFSPFSGGFITISSPVTGKCGYLNKALELAIPFDFKEVRPFSNGFAAVKNVDGNWGYINTSGKLVIPYLYSLAPGPFRSGLAKVQAKDGKFGFINANNSLVIQPKYRYATNFYRGYALARESSVQPIVLIDTAGTVVASFPKDLLYIDTKQTVALSGTADESPYYVPATLQQLVDEGLGVFQKGGNYGLMDNKGQVALDFKYQYLGDLHKGRLFAHYYAYVNNGPFNQFGIIDVKGNWLVEIVPSQF